MLPLLEFQDSLKKIVKGQDEAINKLSTTIYKYLIKQFSQDQGLYFEGATSMLLVGQSGVGKTYLIKQAAKLSNLHMIEINAKSITQEGWSGKSFIDMVKSKTNAWHNVDGGIIFIDEFDKICVPNASSTDDDVNYHIQSSILKYVEGMDAGFLDFNKCLFVFAGAFVDLDINKAIQKEIGFNGANKDSSETLNKALIKYGLIEELAGRIQEKIVLNKLDKQIYLDLLDTPTFYSQLWKEALLKLDISLDLDYNKLIEEAEETNLGVRGLISAVEDQVTRQMLTESHQIDLDKFSPLYIKPEKN